MEYKAFYLLKTISFIVRPYTIFSVGTYCVMSILGITKMEKDNNCLLYTQ